MMITSLLDLFDQTVAKHSECVAVRHNGQKISFSELQAKAQEVGEQIARKHGTLSKQPIAVFLPKEINVVIADLGIMYACRPFMNLDIKTPMDRIRNILRLVKPAAVVTSSKYAAIFCEEDVDVFDIEAYAYKGEPDTAFLKEIRNR